MNKQIKEQRGQITDKETQIQTKNQQLKATEDEYDQWVKNKVAGWADGVKALSKVARTSPQCAFAGLQKSLQSEWMHLQRATGGIGPLFAPVEAAISQFSPSPPWYRSHPGNATPTAPTPLPPSQVCRCRIAHPPRRIRYPSCNLDSLHHHPHQLPPQQTQVQPSIPHLHHEGRTSPCPSQQCRHRHCHPLHPLHRHAPSTSPKS